MAEASFDVFETLVLVRRATRGPAQHGQMLDRDGQLAQIGTHHRAGDPDPVPAAERAEADVEIVAGRAAVDKELERPAPVANHAEGQSAVAADQHQPTRATHRLTGSFARRQ